jgi:hypothetical protein
LLLGMETLPRGGSEKPAPGAHRRTPDATIAKSGEPSFRRFQV